MASSPSLSAQEHTRPGALQKPGHLSFLMFVTVGPCPPQGNCDDAVLTFLWG